MNVKCFISSFLVFVLLSINLIAQTTPEKISDIIGKRVRIYAPQVTDQWMKGKVEDVSADTLKLYINSRAIPKSVPFESIVLFEVNTSPPKHKLKSALKGGFLGTTIGAFAGFVIWGVQFGSKYHMTREFSYRSSPSRATYVITSSLIGGISGLLIGTISGISTEKWEKYSIEELQKE